MTEAATTEALAVVQSFCAAWSRLDLDELLAYFTTDAVYHNIPIDPVTGVEAIRAVFEMFTSGVTAVEFRVVHIAEVDDVVLTERVDVFTLAHTTIELPVMGTFEITGGKISAWRDYFDLQQYMSQAMPTA